MAALSKAEEERRRLARHTAALRKKRAAVQQFLVQAYANPNAYSSGQRLTEFQAYTGEGTEGNPSELWERFLLELALRQAGVLPAEMPLLHRPAARGLGQFQFPGVFTARTVRPRA